MMRLDPGVIAQALKERRDIRIRGRADLKRVRVELVTRDILR
jgi:hypothetical protein